MYGQFPVTVLGQRTLSMQLLEAVVVANSISLEAEHQTVASGDAGL